MKKLSRLLALLVALMLLASLSVSCKKKDDAEDATIASSSNSDSKTEGTDEKEKTDSTSDKKEEDDKKDEGANKDNKPQSDNKVDNTDKTDNNKTENNKTDGGSTTVKPQTPAGTDKGDGAGAYKEDEKGNITQTGNHEVDTDFVIQTEVTNDNGFIPDEEQGLEKSERFATEQSKYNFDQNPLINRDRQVNRDAMPSFDVDQTGFIRAGTKLKDLKGKTIQFFTADWFSTWSYRNAKGETVGEHEWFKQLKSELGLNIKFTIKQHDINIVLQYMNAGKQCDLIYSNHVTLCPQALCISKSITSLVNINNLGSSPGVCKKTMDLCKWGNTLRLIAPIGVVDLLWYNQTLTQELGLPDPHVMWENKAWNWDTFKKYCLAAPRTTKDGKELVTWTCFGGNVVYTWDSTTGKAIVANDATASTPTLINNFLDSQVMAAYEFLASVNQQCNFKHGTGFSEQYSGGQVEHIGLYLGTTLMSATMYTQVYRDTEYSKHIQINWVPFPKAPTAEGRDSCQYYGFGMLLPRKTAKPDNVNYTLKFMELWATRFTETYFDNLNTFEYYNFNYKQRKQYFDFVTQNVVFSAGGATGTFGNMQQAWMGNAAYNIRTEMTKHANEQASKLIEVMTYGN